MKIFYALSFVLILSLQARSQSARTPATERPASTRVIKFYPNPATSVINFDIQKEDPQSSYNFQIFSFVGKKVFELGSVTSKTVVNLNDFYRGIYIFQLRDKNGKIIDSGKFQVSK